MLFILKVLSFALGSRALHPSKLYYLKKIITKLTKQALVLLRVSVKYFGGLDSSYFLEMLREKRKIRKENLPLIQNGSEHKGQNLE